MTSATLVTLVLSLTTAQAPTGAPPAAARPTAAPKAAAPAAKKKKKKKASQAQRYVNCLADGTNFGTACKCVPQVQGCPGPTTCTKGKDKKGNTVHRCLYRGKKPGAFGFLKLPESASTPTSKHIDPIWWLINVICAFFFTLLVIIMVYFVIKYRRKRPDQKTSPVSHNTKLEIAWSVVPAVLLVIIFFAGFKGWMSLNVPPQGAIEVRVTAQKWSWEFQHSGLPLGDKVLIVPKGKPVKLLMSSKDVLHSFYVPAFRVKRDVVPGRYTVLWFQATKIGVFDVRCAEYCGDQHSRMITKVVVVPYKIWLKWYADGGAIAGKSSVEIGKYLFSSKGCDTCHDVSKSRRKITGPPLYGIYGKMEQMAKGPAKKVDDNYIRDSIRNPQKDVVAGFEDQNMNPFPRSALSDDQLNNIIDFLKSLGAPKPQHIKDIEKMKKKNK